MKCIKAAALAAVIAGVMLPRPSLSEDDGSAWYSFHVLPDQTKSQYIGISIIMALAVATQSGNQEQVDCLKDWYLDDFDDAQERNKEIMAAIDKHKEHAPTGIIYWIVRKQCGHLGGKQKLEG